MRKAIFCITLVGVLFTLSPVVFSDTAPPPSPNIYAMIESSSSLSTNAQLQTIEAEIDASNAENTNLANNYSKEIQQINQEIAAKNQSSNKSSASKDIGLVEDVAMIAVGTILIMDGSDLKPALLSLMIIKPNTLYLIGVSNDTIKATAQNPSQFQMLRKILKKAASAYMPHIYLVGPDSPHAVRDLMKLAVREHVAYEPGNVSLEELVNSVEAAVAPSQRINISTATMPDMATETPKLDDAILRVLSRINFVAINGDYIHLRPEGTHLFVELFKVKKHHVVLQKALDVSGLKPADVVRLARGLVKHYREGGTPSHKPQLSTEKPNHFAPGAGEHSFARR